MKTYIKIILFVALYCIISINAISQETKPATTDQPAAFVPSGKLWGYVIGDYYYKTHADSLSRGSTQYAGKNAAGITMYPKDYNAFAFRRIYLGYDYNISESFSSEFLLVHENDNIDNIGQRTVFIKLANLRWKNILHNNDLVVGQVATPVFSLAEKVWGYRSIEKTITDMRGLGKANDVGILWQGKLNDKGDYGYNFMIANGTAQKLETDKYKKLYGELYAKFLDQKIILDVTSDYEPLSTTQSKTTFKGFAAYQTDLVTAGVELLTQSQKNAGTDTASGPKKVNVTPFGLSFFVRGQAFPNKLNYFVRFDSYDPNTNYTSTLKLGSANYNESFFTAGFDYTPFKNVHFMPNIWMDSYSSLKKGATSLAKSDYDLTARLTFFYIFK